MKVDCTGDSTGGLGSSSNKYKLKQKIKNKTKQQKETLNPSTESSPHRWEIMMDDIDPRLGQLQGVKCQISVGLNLPRG